MTHALFFGAGYWGIQQIQIPAKEERALVLTLESTPLDNIRESLAKPEATFNNATLSKKAQSAQSDSSTITQDITAPSTSAVQSDEAPEQEAAQLTASTNNTQLAADPIPEVSLAFQPEPTETVNTLQASASAENVTEKATLADTSFDKVSPITQSNTKASPVNSTPSIDNTSTLLTSNNSDLAISVVNTAPQTEAVPLNDTAEKQNNSPLSSRQQKRLEKKLNSWAQKLKDNAVIPESMNWQAQGQSYTANIRQLPATNEMEMDELLVEVLTEQNGQQFSTTMRMKKLAFSNFAQFIHRWDPNVVMHNDEMDGRFHSNSSISVDYTETAKPTFHSKVTTASHQINLTGRSARKNVFLGGLETGVKRIRMPKPQPLFADSVGDTGSDTVFFEHNTRIIFIEDGHYLWQAIDQHGPAQCAALGNKATYMIGAPGKTLYVSGKVKGQVLVYSPRLIIIEGNLIYADQTPNSAIDHGSLLGLVSGGNVEIAGKDVIPPGDLEIHAAIYAKQRFAVRSYRSKESGTLIIHGSLTSGSLSATEPRYATKISFDTRLEKLRPPGFPVTNRYELAATEHQWQAVALPEPQETPYLPIEEQN